MLTGIDISTWQGGVDFAAARAAGVQFCILKAGGSNSGRYTDSKYYINEPRARAAGMYIGHYWFNGTGDAVTDADYFVDHLSNYKAGDLLVLDIESEGSMPAWGPGQAWQFCVRVRSRLGVVPTVYMSSSVTRATDWSSLVAIGCPLWVASYGANTGSPGASPGNLGPWGNDWSLWQYTSNATFPGYSGRLDANLAKDGVFTQPQPQPTDEGFDIMALPVIVRQTQAGKPNYGLEVGLYDSGYYKALSSTESIWMGWQKIRKMDVGADEFSWWIAQWEAVSAHIQNRAEDAIEDVLGRLQAQKVAADKVAPPVKP